MDPSDPEAAISDSEWTPETDSEKDPEWTPETDSEKDAEWIPETDTEEKVETGNENEEAWEWGATVSISMKHPGKGKDLEYWREELGWLGEYPLRDIYHRYTAIGDPTVPWDEEEEDSDGLLPRYNWNIETGTWEMEDQEDDETESIEPPSPVKPPKKKPCRMLWADRHLWIKD